MVFDPEKITFFAKADARGKNTPFGIKAIDRQRHMYVIGKTGMGKSTLLENMAVQDIQSGEGCAFIDPHGSTAETLLHYVPESRQEDVFYFAPFDMEYPVSFNVMEDVGADKRHLVVSGLMSVFEKIWVDAWSARMAYILQNTIQALLEYPGSTLLGINRMLSDKDYRRLVIDNIEDPSIKSFWVDEFLRYNERYMQEAGDAIKNKIGQFTANPLIRNIVGQPKSSFDIREMMDQQKIIIMNLSKGLVGETNANLLGSMLTTRIYLAAMSRADCSPEAMKQLPNFYFYVDEFQSFANATFANILSEARKYKLNLTIAHQYIEQMEEEVKNAVFGNVGTIVSFRVGPFDAEILESIFSPQFQVTDICNLGFAQIYLTLMIDGVGSVPFSAVTMPPIEPAETSYKDCIVAISRKNYGRPRAEVEKMVTEFHQPVKKAGGGNKPPAKKKHSTEKNIQPPVVTKNINNKRRPNSDYGKRPERFSESSSHNSRNRDKGSNKGNKINSGGGKNNPYHKHSNHKHSNRLQLNKERKPKNKPTEKDRDPHELKSVLAKIAKADKSKYKNQATKGASVEKKIPAPDLGRVVNKVMATTTKEKPKASVPDTPLKKTTRPNNSPSKTSPADTKSHRPRRPTKEITAKELKRQLRVPEGEQPPLRK